MRLKLSHKFLLLLLTLSASGLVLACDDEPPPIPQGAPPVAASSPVNTAPAAAAANPQAPGVSQAGEAAKKQPDLLKPPELTDKDFIEGPQNRDPFRSFIEEFAKPVKRITEKQLKVIAPRYALDELLLIGVVTGGTRPQAMFRDPTGLGISVQRGDYVSKSAAKVKQILGDKVVVEIEEQAESKTNVVDRVIELRTKSEQEIIGE